MSGRRPVKALWVTTAIVAIALVAAPAAGAREPLDITVFTRVGQPGQPEPIAVGPDGRIYVGTNQLNHGDARAPSKVFAYSPAGELVEEYVIEGQPLSQSHGIQGLLFDEAGLLYALDRSANPRVIRIDPATGEQRDYARFRDVPPCTGTPDGNCAYDVSDSAAGPDYGVFAADGTMYVTDIDQALIWRVPRGGGDAEVWFTDPRLESVFGPNGIQFMADGRTLLFANTASNPFAGDPTTGRLYTLPVQPDGGPGQLTQVWESLPLDAPDGLAIARSGNVYVALAGSSQVLMLSPQFTELARVPADLVANQSEEIPLDGPGSIVFDGERLLVSNHSPIFGNPASWAILDVFAGEPGLPLSYPQISKPELGLDVKLKETAKANRFRLKIKALRTLAASVVPVEGAKIKVRGKRKFTNGAGKAKVRIRWRGRKPLVVKGSKPGFESRKVTLELLDAVRRG